MAVTVTHAKTNNIADWTQEDLNAQIGLGNYPEGTQLSDIVLPSDWNHTHTVVTTSPTSYVSGTFSITTASDNYVVNTSGGAGTGNLPSASDGTNKFNIAITSTANTCQINPAGTDKINGTFTFATIRGSNTAATFQSDGVNNWTITAGA